MNFKRQRGIVYHKMKSVQADNMLIYKPVPAPIDKIQNKYRWRMVIKSKINTKTLDILTYSTQDEILTKMKNTTIIIDINPNNMT